MQRHTRQYGTEFSVTEFADGVDILENYRPVYDIVSLDGILRHIGNEDQHHIRIQRPVYDIVFLDVEMKHLDGRGNAGGSGQHG